MAREFENIEPKNVQFFKGHVVQVYLNETDQPISRDALSSQSIRVKFLDSDLSTMSPTVPAFPLMRGMNDSVTRGDLVLITLMYERYFYIGPINTINTPNVAPNPVWNDLWEIEETVGGNKTGVPNGYGQNYPIADVPKLQKNRNNVLDNLVDNYYHVSKHTDFTLEGRHGNSLRLGSRDIFPILNLYNTNKSIGVENPMNGSLISFLSNGSIDQNLGFFRLSTDSTFTLQGSTNINPKYQINIGNSKSKDDIQTTENLDSFYNFSFEVPEESTKNELNQILITSDRLIFNSRSGVGDITISSGRNINLGSAQNFTLNNQGQSVINSGNIYLGESSRSKKEPLVLGDELRILLLEIMNILQESRALVQGVPIPLVKSDSSLMFDRIQAVINQLQPREIDNDTNLPKPNNTKFLSQHHYIEINNRS